MTNKTGRPKRARRVSAVTLRFRCTAAEKRRWKSKARKLGHLSLSEFIRSVLDSCE